MPNAFPTADVKIIYVHTRPSEGAVTMVTVPDSAKEHTSCSKRRWQPTGLQLLLLCCLLLR